MSTMSPKNKRLFIAAMLISMLQMIFFAPTSGIAKIKAEVFTTYSLASIQTAMMLPSLISMAFSVVSAVLISGRLLSKKVSVTVGLVLISLTGVVVLLAHNQFWQLELYSALIGAGMGFYISPLSSILFDNFSETERRMSMGAQTVFINVGGIILSVIGGLLAQFVWFGGYLITLLAVPFLIVCLIVIPNDHPVKENAHKDKPREKFHLPADIFYYGVISALFTMMFNVCSTNISSHLASGHLGNTATAGVATACQMAGGVAAGFLFSRLSSKVKDYAMAVAFFLIFAGYMIISVGHASLAVNMIGVFIAGSSISILVPQVLFAVSNRVSESNSAAATAIVNSILPGIGGYFSPAIFTNLTTAIRGDSTVFRFAFVACSALAVGLLIVMTTRLRAKKGIKAAP